MYHDEECLNKTNLCGKLSCFLMICLDKVIIINKCESIIFILKLTEIISKAPHSPSGAIKQSSLVYLICPLQ